VGPALDLQRGGPCEPDLDQALDRCVEQRAPGLLAALLLGARCARRIEPGLGHPGGVLPPQKQSVKTVCMMADMRGRARTCMANFFVVVSRGHPSPDVRLLNNSDRRHGSLVTQRTRRRMTMRTAIFTARNNTNLAIEIETDEVVDLVQMGQET